MKTNACDGHGDLSADWATGRLKAISSIDPPRHLRGRLDAGIPESAVPTPAMRWRWRARWAGAAAAAIVIVSIAAWRGVPWEGRGSVALDANSRSGRAFATDHNSLRPSDINLCDINGLR